jgi:hypothetical protein
VYAPLRSVIPRDRFGCGVSSNIDEQMLVVGHQDKGMQAPAVLIHGPRKPVEPMFAIPIVPDDIGVGIAP